MVTRPVVYPVGRRGAPSFVATVAAAGRHADLRVTSFVRREGGEEAADLGLDPDSRIAEVVRVGRIDGHPAAHVTSILPADLVGDLGADLAGRPLARLSGRGHRLRTRLRVELGVPPGSSAGILRLPQGSPCWLVRSHSLRLPSGRTVEAARMWLRPSLVRVVWIDQTGA